MGSILLTDLENAPEHAIAAVLGAIAGYAFGASERLIHGAAQAPGTGATVAALSRR